MAAYLTDHPPVRDQWYTRRTRPLTGCTVLHSTESVFDEMGEDTGAEGVAEFIRTRTTPGSYHDLVDSDSWIRLVDYNHGAYHDGTGSNNWALSLAFACRTVDWNRMPPGKRKAMLRRGAIAFAAQQAYRRSIGAPLTDLRLITKAQSDRGMSGLTYHGFRDPDRRTDPGVAAPNLFPIDEFITECRAALGGTTTPDVQEDDDMKVIQAEGRGAALVGASYYRQLLTDEEFEQAKNLWGSPVVGNARQFDVWVSVATTGQTILDTPIQRSEQAGGGVTTLRAQTHWADYNLRTVVPEAVAKVVATPQIDAEAFASQVAEALAGKVGLSREDVKSAMGEVLIQGAGTTV